MWLNPLCFEFCFESICIKQWPQNELWLNPWRLLNSQIDDVESHVIFLSWGHADNFKKSQINSAFKILKTGLLNMAWHAECIPVLSLMYMLFLYLKYMFVCLPHAPFFVGPACPWLQVGNVWLQAYICVCACVFMPLCMCICLFYVCERWQLLSPSGADSS